METTARVVETDVESVPISPRRSLKVGDTFRVKRNSGPLSRLTRRATAGVPYGRYRALRLYRTGSDRKPRFYCEAVEDRSGRTHTLYVHGPSFKSQQLPAVLVRPYSIALVSETKGGRHER